MRRSFLRSRFSTRVNPCTRVRPRTVTSFTIAAAAAVHDDRSSSASMIVSWRSQASNPCLEMPSLMSWEPHLPGAANCSRRKRRSQVRYCLALQIIRRVERRLVALGGTRELASSSDRRLMQCFSDSWPRSCSSFLSCPSTGSARPCSPRISPPSFKVLMNNNQHQPLLNIVGDLLFLHQTMSTYLVLVLPPPCQNGFERGPTHLNLVRRFGREASIKFACLLVHFPTAQNLSSQSDPPCPIAVISLPLTRVSR
jgi:hypothetical protein